MSAQLAIDFAAARAARDAGMTQAIQHAERVDDEWPDAALDFLFRYARTHSQFISEEATAEAARLGLASPSDPRAWGAIFKRAASTANGAMPFIQKVGYGISQRRHLSPTPLWRSLVFAGVPA